VLGTGFDVWEIIAGYEEMGRKRVLEESGISEDRLDAALAYHRAYWDEVDQKIKENHARCDTGASVTLAWTSRSSTTDRKPALPTLLE
jgi:hypothetical protein